MNNLSRIYHNSLIFSFDFVLDIVSYLQLWPTRFLYFQFHNTRSGTGSRWGNKMAWWTRTSETSWHGDCTWNAQRTNPSSYMAGPWRQTYWI